MDSDPEAEARAEPRPQIDPLVPAAEPLAERLPVPCANWPFDAAEAQRRQCAADPHRRVIQLAEGVTLELPLIPAGDFVMGSEDGCADERPRARVRIDKPFWIGLLEVTNQQFELFDPSHDSRVESRFGMQFGVRGFYVNRPQQPVVRVSWEQAMEFCRWLSNRTGEHFTLPTEAQWEYACRAGSDTPFYYGDHDTDFSRFANLADAKLSEFVCHPYKKSAIRIHIPASTTTGSPKTLVSTTGVSCRNQVAFISPTHGACTTCTATSPNGLAPPIVPIRAAPTMDVTMLTPHNNEWCAAAPGAIDRRRRAAHTAQPIVPTRQSTTWDFA